MQLPRNSASVLKKVERSKGVRALVEQARGRGCLIVVLELKHGVEGRGLKRNNVKSMSSQATWCTHFPNAKVLNLPILASDHSPILLSTCEVQQRLNYPFRFMEVWTSSPDCEKVIDLAWKYDFNGRRDDILIRKLDKTKRDLKVWNQNSFGFCDRKLRMFKQELVEIQNKLPSKENLEREASVQVSILEMESNLERIWKQKSREHWVCKGDGNTKFFHASTVIRRRRNSIESVNNDGTWLNNRKDIVNYMRNQFIKVNKQKSGVSFSPNTPLRCREVVKSTMDIDGLSHKEKYLGNPFFFSARKRRDFQFLKDKVMGRLDGHMAEPGEVSLLATQDWTDPFCSSDLVPFHTDASILNDEVGCAAVLRAEEDGKMAWVATDFKKGAGILEGELLAILLALQVARQCNIPKIKVLSDSKVAVMALNLGCLPLA
ncbi:hypothetical protein F8388_019078 [Cannabis sativa]|uniref:RNase H type-1 domain-containing protein n=1 Tax=Cannabis sativa TaxID=3483 RepID=A0A7J6FCD6_CANSA|nr:hypothetical protein F8388_019078 [Cannabis sativa]